MPNITLELDALTINLEKKRWNLYFIVGAEHPTESDKWILYVYPPSGQTIALRPQANNRIDFAPSGANAEGMAIFSRPMPENRQANVHIYLRHSREGLKSVSDILKEIKTELGGAISDISTIFSGISTGVGGAIALVIGKEFLPKVGDILAQIPDRDLGFVSMFERFGFDFAAQTSQERTANFTTGMAKISWTWVYEP